MTGKVKTDTKNKAFEDIQKLLNNQDYMQWAETQFPGYSLCPQRFLKQALTDHSKSTLLKKSDNLTDKNLESVFSADGHLAKYIKEFRQQRTQLDLSNKTHQDFYVQMTAVINSLTNYHKQKYPHVSLDVGKQAPVEGLALVEQGRRDNMRQAGYLEMLWEQFQLQNILQEFSLDIEKGADEQWRQLVNQKLISKAESRLGVKDIEKFTDFLTHFLPILHKADIAQAISGSQIRRYFHLYIAIDKDIIAESFLLSQDAASSNVDVDSRAIAQKHVQAQLEHHAANSQLDQVDPVVIYQLGEHLANPDQALASKVETDAVVRDTIAPEFASKVEVINSDNVVMPEVTARPVVKAEVAVAKQENAIDTIVKRLEKVNEYSGGVQVNLPKVIALLTIAAKAMHDGDDAQLKSALLAAGAVVKGRMSFWNQALSCRAMSFFSSNNAWAGVQRQQAYEALLPLVHINSPDAKDVNAALSNINNKLDTVLAKEEGMKMSKGIQCAVSVDSAQGQNKAASSEVPTVVDYLSMR